ncbi:MAG: NUDIX domain-containing protein [Bacteroidota bacterium]
MSSFIIKARLVLKKANQVLLLTQTNEKGGKLTLPGGTVEGPEFALETLVRECQEEIGITLNPTHLSLIHVLHKKKGKDNRITIYFTTTQYQGTLHVRETNKFQGFAWASLRDLPPKTSPTVKHVIRQINQNVQYSEWSKKIQPSQAPNKLT